MDIRRVDEQVSVAPQIGTGDVAAISELGFRSIVCNRPDGEANDQPSFAEIEQVAKQAGLTTEYMPVESGKVGDGDADIFQVALDNLPRPILAYCRTGTRSITLWALAAAKSRQPAGVLAAVQDAGYDIRGLTRRLYETVHTRGRADLNFDVVIVGAGSAGVAAASSLQRRKPDLQIALIDPADVHYYQPGWTLVGAGVFSPQVTVRTMAAVIPPGIHWLKAAVAAFEPENNAVELDGGRRIGYRHLVVAPGLKLDWHAVEGLVDTLGENGVTSNYRFDLAPYTWELTKNLAAGSALFTQPPMPIKCAGAPQKAMYLAADYWQRNHRLSDLDIRFLNAGGALFGVKEFVPALMNYVKRYELNLDFNTNLVAVDGPARTAWFDVTDPEGQVKRVERRFDMMHVCPPQAAPDFIRVSPLADAAGWLDVDQNTLRHKQFENIYGAGDVISAANAKTAAAARKQAPLVAQNILHDLVPGQGVAHYDGYGSCPLTVERGKVLLAEFGYGGKLLPTFPKWLIDGTRPSRPAWLLKEKFLPSLYWKGMLKGREWLARPELVD